MLASAENLPKYDVKLIVNGRMVPASDGAVFHRLFASGDGVATTAPAAGPRDANDAANSAASSFPLWSTSPDAFREEILLKSANNIEARTEEFIAAMAAETGATEAWARFNCSIAGRMFRHAASVARYDRVSKRVGLDPEVTSQLERRPAGVVLAIAPWNAPVVLASRAIAIPLACGNTVVLKASERCPKTHALVVEAVIDAGAPDGVINLITNAPDAAAEISQTLISHTAVRRVNFTGSTRVGRQIAQTCAAQLKPVVLELSGKAPLIVLDDADLDAAVAAAAFGAFFNQGQICISTDRIIVADAVADEFVDKLKHKTRTLTVGDPAKANVHLGPMISADAAIRVKNLIEDAVRKGATLVVGGEVEKSTMHPAVLDRVDRSMKIYSDECFGPVVAVIRARNDEEAVTLANDTEFGLAASVFSRDVSRARRVADQLDCGICQINGPTVYDDPSMPFGGLKASGYGRLSGEESVAEFTELRWIAVHEREVAFPF